MLVHLVVPERDALRIVLEVSGASVRTEAQVRRDVDVVVVDDLAFARMLREAHPQLAIVLVAPAPPPSELALEHVTSLEPARIAAWLEELVARRRAAQFTSELAALRAGFAARLPTRLAELGAAIAAGHADPQHLATARVLAHRLGGSSGSYGHVALGAILEAIERELDAGRTGRLDELMATARANLPRDREREPGSSESSA